MNEEEPDILAAARQEQGSRDGPASGVDAGYSQAARRLKLLLDRNGNEKVNLRGIRVLGSPNTRQGFLTQVIDSCISARPHDNLKSCLNGLSEAANKLSRFDIYDSVSLDIDAASPTKDNLEDGDGQDLEATFRLKERSRMWFRTGTDFGNQEGNAYASANLRNVFGGAETVEGNVTFGTRTKTSYEAKFVSPLRADPDRIVEVTGFGANKVNAYASHDENVQGINVKVKQAGPWAYHEFGVLAADRQITNIRRDASFSIRQCAGASRKLSFFNTITRDRRDNTILPTRGYRLRSSQEVALGGILGSDAAASFAKVEVDGSHHSALTADRKTSLNLAFRSGLLWSGRQTTHLSDRFQLGGPQSVRGFLYNGLGPRDGRDSLGGTAYLATGISLMTPVPRVPDSWPIKFHTFINTGSLIDLHQQQQQQQQDGSGLRRGLRELCTRPSITTGFGLAFEHPMARLEVSFCIPIACRSSDRPRKGLQFGLGVDFL